MKKSLFVVQSMIVSVSLLLTIGAERAGAQGPAGAGASTLQRAVRIHRGREFAFPESHQVVKKRQGSKNSIDSNGSRSDTEKKLTPKRKPKASCRPIRSHRSCELLWP